MTNYRAGYKGGSIKGISSKTVVIDGKQRVGQTVDYFFAPRICGKRHGQPSQQIYV